MSLPLSDLGGVVVFLRLEFVNELGLGLDLPARDLLDYSGVDLLSVLGDLALFDELLDRRSGLPEERCSLQDTDQSCRFCPLGCRGGF